jgi:hypothetical protein
LEARNLDRDMTSRPLQQRHLNERTRREFDEKARAAACRKELRRRLPPGHPLRKDAEERGPI